MRGIAAVLSLLLITSPLGATTRHSARHKKTRKKHTLPIAAAAPPVQPAVRTAAVAFVTERATRSTEAIENPAGLVPFFEQLSHPPAGAPLHIMQYGDSHTASDDWVNAMRAGLQSRFGSGGPGFALAGRPYRGYRRFDVRGGSSSAGWTADGLVKHPGDGIYGLGGISITAQSPGETVTVSTDCPTVQLFYLQQPGGGQLEFSIDGRPVETVTTDGPFAPAYFRPAIQPGEHEYLLRTLSSAPVRLFGWVTERKIGITFETLGINGANAPMLLEWNESVLANQLAQHDPALIVIAYGTNDALSPHFTVAGYRAAFKEVIARFRRASPTAGILVIGPPDCQMRVGSRRAPYPHLNEVTEIQRGVAYEHGCAFWDWRAHMGGPGSISEWANAGLGQPDHVHLTTGGYRLLGELLLDQILGQYKRFLAVQTE